MQPPQRRTRPAGAPGLAGPAGLKDPAAAEAIRQLQRALADVAARLPESAPAGRGAQTRVEVLTPRLGRRAGTTLLHMRRLVFEDGRLVGQSAELAAGELEVGTTGAAAAGSGDTVTNVTNNINIYLGGYGVTGS